MSKVIVVTKDGFLEEIYCRNKNIEIELIDIGNESPGFDEKEYKRNVKRYAEINKSESYKCIY